MRVKTDRSIFSDVWFGSSDTRSATPIVENPVSQDPKHAKASTRPQTQTQALSPRSYSLSDGRPNSRLDTRSAFKPTQEGYWLYYWVTKPVPLTALMDPIAAMVKDRLLKTIKDADIQGRSADSIYLPPGGYIRLYAYNEYVWHNRLRVNQDLLRLHPVMEKLGLKFSHAETTLQKATAQEWDHDANRFDARG